jgi:hypothetical protein
MNVRLLILLIIISLFYFLSCKEENEENQQEISLCCEYDSLNNEDCQKIGKVVFIYHYYGQSNSHEVVISDATTAKFKETLEELAGKNAIVDRLDIWGHGQTGYLFLYDGKAIDATKEKITIELGNEQVTDITDLLQDLLKDNAEVYLYSCTSGDDNLLADKFSIILKDRTIIGYKGEIRYVPFIWLPIGDSVKWRNGELIED